jgi:hypothetical protein
MRERLDDALITMAISTSSSLSGQGTGVHLDLPIPPTMSPSYLFMRGLSSTSHTLRRRKAGAPTACWQQLCPLARCTLDGTDSWRGVSTAGLSLALVVFIRERSAPAEALEIDVAVRVEPHPLRFEQGVLDRLVMPITARADTACRIDHPLPRNIRTSRQGMQGIADGSGGAGMAKPAGDLPVGRHLSRRDLRHQTIDRRIEIRDLCGTGACRFHPSHPFHRSPEAASSALHRNT